MLSPRSSQARSRSSTRVQLARDLHDSLAQDLVAIGYKLDLLTAALPYRFRSEAREIRFLVSECAAKVRQQLFALRARENIDQLSILTGLEKMASPLKLEVVGDLTGLSKSKKRIVDELVRNAATHSKGRNIKVEVSETYIKVSDDGQGLFGLSELVGELNGELSVQITSTGTEVVVTLP